MNAISTAEPARVGETMRVVDSMGSSPMSKVLPPPPVMTWQEMQRLVAKGLVKLPEEVTRLAKFRRKQLPLVETKQPQTWDTAKLHGEVTTEFRQRENGE